MALRYDVLQPECHCELAKHARALTQSVDVK